MLAKEIISTEDDFHEIKIKDYKINEYINSFLCTIKKREKKFIEFHEFYHNEMFKDINGIPYDVSDINTKSYHFKLKDIEEINEGGRWLYEDDEGFLFKCYHYQEMLYFYLIDDDHNIITRFSFKEGEEKKLVPFIDFINGEDFFILFSIEQFNISMDDLKVKIDEYETHENDIDNFRNLYKEVFTFDKEIDFEKELSCEDEFWGCYSESEDSKIKKKLLNIYVHIKENSCLNNAWIMEFVDFKITKIKTSEKYKKEICNKCFGFHEVENSMYMKALGERMSEKAFKFDFIKILNYEEEEREYQRCMEMLENGVDVINPFNLNEFAFEMYKINYSI